MKLNTSYSLRGILGRRCLIIFILLSHSVISNAQFSHRFEFLIEKTVSLQSDKISLSQDNISYYEKTNRIASGVTIGIKYNVLDFPLVLFLGYENFKSLNYSINSNVNVFDKSQKLLIKSADFNIQYSLFNRSTFNPHVFVGLSYNAIDYSRTGISYYYTETSNDQDLQIEVEWRYNLVQSGFKTAGLNFGAGINIRFSDKIGVSGDIKFRHIPQNYSKWLDNHILIKTFCLGVHYRILKRKNYI